MAASFGSHLTLWGEGTIAPSSTDWAEVVRRLGLSLPADFPWPQGTAGVRVSLELSTLPGEPLFQLVFTATAHPAPDCTFGGLTMGGPVRVRIAAEFVTEGGMQAAVAAWDSGGSLSFSGRLSLELPVRLPALPEWDFFRLRTGDRDGWIKLKLEAGFTTTASGGAAELDFGVSVVDLFSAELRMPGAAPDAVWLRFAFESLEGRLRVRAGQVSGSLTLRGSFSAQLRSEWLITRETAALEPLVVLLQRKLPDEARLAGTVEGTLSFTNNVPELLVACSIDDAEINVGLHELLDFLRTIVRGQTPDLAALKNSEPSEADVKLTLGSLQVRISREPMIAFELEGTLPGMERPLPAFISVGYRQIGGFELNLGLGRALPKTEFDGAVSFPLRIPHIAREPLEKIADLYRERLKPHQDGLDRFNTVIEAYFDAIESAFDLLSSANSTVVAEKIADEWQIAPSPGAPVPSPKCPVVVATGSTQGSREFVVAYNSGAGWRPLLIKPAIHFKKLSLSIPFQNVRDIRVSGTVQMTCEGPLQDISRLPLTLGLSTDMVYASVDTEGGVSIEVPELLPGYDKGRITIGQCRIGFGYTKRSFAFSFAGELVLPRQLLDDLDTSDEIGVGIRVPEKTNLAVRFDLIPMVFGKLVIPLPMFQLNLDLRQGTRGLLRNHSTCEPGWDGLQLIVPGALRAGIERFSFNPLLGGIVAYWNSDFAGDLLVGDERNGLTLCLDNGFWAYAGDPSIYTIPLIPIMSVPFCDDACVSLRLGGFTFALDVQRPLPTFSPMALFELLALASDPLHYEVAPRGELADMVRVTLADTRLQLPEPVYRIFPGAASIPLPRREATINLATYIRLLQHIGRAVSPVVEKAIKAAREQRTRQLDWKSISSSLRGASLGTLTRGLAEQIPPGMRQFGFTADFAGFHGSASLGFTSRQELLRATHAAKPAPKAGETMQGMAWDAEAMEGFQPKFRGGAPVTEPLQVGVWLQAGAFAGVTEADINDVPLPLPEPQFSPEDITDEFIHWILDNKSPLANYLRRQIPSKVGKNDPKPKKDLDEGLRPVAAPSRAAAVLFLNRELADAEFFTPSRFPRLPGWLQQRVDALKVGKPKKGEHTRERVHRQLLELALPQFFSAEPGLWCAASVRVFEADLSFIGWIDGEGRFALATRGDLMSPQLSIAGANVSLPLQLQGRALLEGRATPQGLAASFSGQASAAADLLPGILSVTVGTNKDPVRFQLWSDGRFRGAGAVQISLLGGQATGGFEMELTQRSLAARGELHAFGAISAETRVQLDAGGLFVAAKFKQTLSNRLPLGFEAQCELRVQPGSGVMALRGSGRAVVAPLDLEIAGTCAWEGGAEVSSRQLAFAGELTWQGIRWAQGSLVWRSDGGNLETRGRVSLSLREILERQNRLGDLGRFLPPLFEDLVVQFDLSVEAGFSRVRATNFAIAGSWQIALRLKGGSHDHILAGSRFGFAAGASGWPDLFDLSGLKIFPVPTFPKPDITHVKELRLMRGDVAGIPAVGIHWDDETFPPGFSEEAGISLPGHFDLRLGDVALPGLTGKVALAWENRRLGVRFKAGSLTPIFAPFAP
ncbi:MAG TPA: hypothetical protein VHO24_00105 [Opitutaceae bacterium]|nr:hypothetical protein [Opitutaceae bacterium]